ncbi:MAG: transcriptional regulator NrdR [Candidatus Omnitrophota bacterium]
MRCPFCGSRRDRVMDSRSSSGGRKIRRRRECIKCKRRFTTYEYVERSALLVVKKDGRREPFDRQKILSGILKACEKRPISISRIESQVDTIEKTLEKLHEREVFSREVGEMVVKCLYDLDEVAYVRFASVYKQFKDATQFMKELRKFLKK